MEPDNDVFDEPLLSREVVDELWNKNDENKVMKISTNAPVDHGDDYVIDETSPDVQMHIIAKEGLANFAGYLGRGRNSRTRRM